MPTNDREAFLDGFWNFSGEESCRVHRFAGHAFNDLVPLFTGERSNDDLCLIRFDAAPLHSGLYEPGRDGVVGHLPSQRILHTEHSNVRRHARLNGLHKCRGVPRQTFQPKLSAESDAMAHAARLLQFLL
jgi:hypothetical protein